MVLDSRQNIAPPRKTFKGHLAVGLASNNTLLATSSLMIVCQIHIHQASL